MLEANQSCKKTFSTLPFIAFRKGISLKKIIGTNTIRNNKKLIKTKNNHLQESVPYATEQVAYAVNNVFQTQHLKVIKPTKRLNLP